MEFAVEGHVFAKILRSLEQFIGTVKAQNNFRNRMFFFNLLLEVSKMRAIRIEIGRINWDLETLGKVRK